MQSVQRFVHPNHGPPAREKIQQYWIRMRLDRLVQQERFLARSDQFAISDSPHGHINMCRRTVFKLWLKQGPIGRVHWSRIEHIPLLVCFEPGAVGSEIHGLASRRHCGETWPGPSGGMLVFSWQVVSILDAPTFLFLPRGSPGVRL